MRKIHLWDLILMKNKKRITLCVGGRNHETYRSTLLSYDLDFFKELLEVNKDKDVIFINQDPDAFSHILEKLRCPEYEIPLKFEYLIDKYMLRKFKPVVSSDETLTKDEIKLILKITSVGKGNSLSFILSEQQDLKNIVKQLNDFDILPLHRSFAIFTSIGNICGRHMEFLTHHKNLTAVFKDLYCHVHEKEPFEITLKRYGIATFEKCKYMIPDNVIKVFILAFITFFTDNFYKFTDESDEE